jgi:hypothetical protein
MPRFLLVLVASLALALFAACAGLEEPTVDPDPPPRTKAISMGLMTNVGPFTGSVGGGVAWELTVDPEEIHSGQRFLADLKGKAIFDERFLSTALALDLVDEGFRELVFTDFQATVIVRKGADGDPVVLTPDKSIQYVCAQTKMPCDPKKNLPGDPGFQGNPDCEGQSETNPCGQLVEFQTNDDCTRGGLCDQLGYAGLCDAYGFCVAGPLELPLTGSPGRYDAWDSGSVLFGYDDREETGFVKLDEGGCNDGTWYIDKPQPADPLGPNGVRIMLGGAVPVIIEFIMGEDSRGDEGIDSCDARSSRSPDSSLIKFPIPEP